MDSQIPTRATASPTRRRLLFTAAGGTSALILAACGGSSGGAPSEAVAGIGPNGFTFKQPVAITYWKSLEGPRHEAQVKLADDFNKMRSDVKVTVEHVGTYDQAAPKLTAALAGGTPPETMLLTVDTYMPSFARQGALYPFDEFAKADKSAQFNKYAPGFIKNGTINGKLYQIPLARSTPLLYFNKDMFKAAGMPETAPDSWDQVLDISMKLQRAGVVQPDNADQSRFVFPAAAYWWTMQSMIWAYGGTLSDDKFNPTVTSPEVNQVFQWLQDIVQRHRVARYYKTEGNSSTAFRAGQLAFYMGSTANLTQIEEGTSSRVGTAFMPKQKARNVPGGGSGMCIMKDIAPEKRQAGWEFIKFATNTPNTIYFSQMTGYMVVRTDAESNPDYQKFLKEHPNAKVTFDQMQYVRTGDSISQLVGSTQAIEAAITDVVSGNKAVKSVLEELQRQLTNIAQDAKK